MAALAKKVLLRKKEWKAQFKESEEIVWIMNYQLELMFVMILFPHIAIFTPILVYLVMRAYYIYLTRFAEKPRSNSNKEDSSTQIYIMINLSILIYVSALCFWYVTKIRHDKWIADWSTKLTDKDGKTIIVDFKPDGRLCGPVLNSISYEDVLGNYFVSTTVDWLYNIFQSYLSFLLFIMAFLIRILFYINKEQITQKFIEDKLLEYKHNLRDLEGHIIKK